MSHSQRLRLSEVRAIFRLIGECRERGADSQTWRKHLAVGASGLLHARVGFVGESPAPARRELTVVQVADCGWESERARARWLAYMSDKEHVHDPALSKLHLAIQVQQTIHRRHYVPDREWYRSTYFRECLEPGGIDATIVSCRNLPGLMAYSTLAFYRALRERGHTPRNLPLLDLLHTELCREIGRGCLATAADPSPRGLPPRLRQVLRGLLEGDSEKQLAARFGLSRDTIHEYVGKLYRYFHVNTRAELLAYFLRRSGLWLPEENGDFPETPED